LLGSTHKVCLQFMCLLFLYICWVKAYLCPIYGLSNGLCTAHLMLFDFFVRLCWLFISLFLLVCLFMTPSLPPTGGHTLCFAAVRASFLLISAVFYNPEPIGTKEGSRRIKHAPIFFSLYLSLFAAVSSKKGGFGLIESFAGVNT
jgi:hypothetical protein